MNTLTTELETVYDARKSFYGKAHVLIDEDGSKRLVSYSTEVLTHDADGIHIHGDYSMTTWRHIREYVAQVTGEVLTKAQLQKRYA